MKTRKKMIKRTAKPKSTRRRANAASLSASELEKRIDAYENAYLVAKAKTEKNFILAQIRKLEAQLKKVQAANKRAFKTPPRKRPPSVRATGAKRKTKRNPQFKVEAKVPSNIRPITHEVKVPSRTLAVLATRGYVQEMGGGNPNAYSYKSTKLGLGKWRVEAIPKVKSSSGTVKALTAGSAVRKFKKTLAGRGRFKTPRGAYEISVARNPKRKRRNPPATGFLAAGKIYRKIEELKRQPLTMRRTAAIYKLEKALEKAYADAYAAERAKDAEIYSAPRTFSTAKRKVGSVRKKKNPKDRSEFKRLYREAVLSFAIHGEPAEMKRVIDLGIRAGATIPAIKRIIAKKKGRTTANRIVNARVLQLQQSGEYSQMKTLSNPRKRKPAVKATRKNSVKSTIKKVVKTVKRVFKKKNDGSSDREEFAGKVSGFKDLYFPPGTPHGLSTLGPLVKISTDKANINPAKGMAVLCQDSNHNLYIGSVTPDAAAFTGSESLRNKNLGKVQRIEYRCSKPHLGAEYKGNITWYHDFEAPLPTLKTDADGRFIFSGGNYTVKREGITG